MKKLVLKIDMPDDAAKRKALKTVAAFPGIDSISVDMKQKRLTIIGTADPTKVVSRLRKYWTTELLIVGPAKEPEVIKKEEVKKDEPPGNGGDKKPSEDGAKKESNGNEQEKKQVVAEEGVKKVEGGGGGEKKEGDQAVAAPAGGKTNGEAAGGGGEKKVEAEDQKKVDPVMEMVSAYRAYNPHMTRYYYAHSMEENPNACVIC